MNNMKKYLISYIHSFSNKYYHRKFLFNVAKRVGLCGLNYFHCKSDKIKFRNIIDIEILHNIEVEKTVLRELWKQYYNKHYFCVLGTGWVKWTYDQEPVGFEGIKIYTPIREEFKTKIAWCRDMRTGYCFNQDALIPIFFDELEKGADIKVPWELARMYHWPQLALLALQDEEECKSIIDEFVFEIEDFCKIPVGESIQYSCAMEIAIRAVNLLIAFDIFTQIDKNSQMDLSFKKKFVALMCEHREIILNRLEVDLENRKNGNHYLANLCGLLFLCSYLQGRESECCFEFACKEFFKEIDAQFLEDGTSIECSTAYHRLASELTILGILMIEKAGKKIPEGLKEKLSGMKEFLHMIKRPDGRIIQIGDNDSGHVINLNPQGKFVKASELGQYNINWVNCFEEDECFFVQEELSAEQVIAMFDALFGKENIKDKVTFSFYKALMGDLPSENSLKNVRFRNDKELDNNIDLENLCFKKESIIYFEKRYDFDRKDIFVSKCFGLIVIKLEDFFLAIRTAPNYKKMRLGHLHYDVLHYELVFGENNYFVDQGSYVYTGHREWRDRFRSDEFHNVPIYQDKWIKAKGIFNNDVRVKGEFFIHKNVINVKAIYKDIIHMRCFKLYKDRLVVRDYSNHEFELSKMTNTIVHSLGYGMRMEEL